MAICILIRHIYDRSVFIMKKYTIIGGMNGVGKSSFTGVLKEQLSDLGIIIDADMLSAKHGGNNVAGGKAAAELINSCLSRSASFTQETTLSGKKTLKTIFTAREKGYYIRLFYVGISSAEESLLRIQNRVKKGGHNIPEADVIRRYENRFESLAAVLPYCNEVHFYDNENGFTSVGEYKCGEIITYGDNIPQWLKSFKEYLNNQF